MVDLFFFVFLFFCFFINCRFGFLLVMILTLFLTILFELLEWFFNKQYKVWRKLRQLCEKENDVLC